MTDADRPAVTWREASVADSLAAAEVNVRSWQESFAGGRWRQDAGDLSVERRAAMFRRRFGASFYRMYVAEAPGEGVIGFVDVGRPRDARWNCDAELYAIYVLKPYQRQGLGHRLFELACDAVRAEGLRSMYLIVIEDSPYRIFYERLGGRQLAQRPAGAVPGQDAHVIYAWPDLRRGDPALPRPAAPDAERDVLAARRSSFECEPAVAALLGLFAAEETTAWKDAQDLAESDWRKFVAEAYRHGVASMVRDRLRLSDRGRTAPSWVLHDLERCYFRTRLDNLRLYGRLTEVLRRFAAQRLDVIVLKGAYLADAVYADHALRSMADIDLLVRREDLARSVGLLREGGWEQPDAPAGETAADDGHQLPTFVRAGVPIEVHWNIEDERCPLSIDVDALWRRSRTALVAGAPARALAPEDLLLHVCLHASYNHGWLPFAQGLRPLRDIASCITHFGPGLDWGVVVRRAQEWKAGHCVWLSLVLARDLVSANVPEQPIARLAPRGADSRTVRTARRLTLGDYYGDVLRSLPVLGRTWLTRQWRHLPLAARWCRHLLPSGKSLASSYPSLHASGMLLPVRYMAHLVDLARDVASLARSRRARAFLAHERDRLALLDWFELPMTNMTEDTAPAVGQIIPSASSRRW